MIGNFLRRFIPDQQSEPEIIIVAANERFYRVALKDGSVRFVDASHPNKAKMHVADSLIESVTVATPRECVEAVRAGISMERPGEPTPQGTLLP